MSKFKDMTEEAFEIYRREFLRAGLRRLSSRWPFAYECMRLARKARGVYVCAKCKGEFRRSQVQRDHIVPVVGKEGFQSLDQLPSFVRNLLVRTEGYQALCRTCHKAKTKTEQGERAASRRKKKEKK
jgi:5-methylcytosine-specific restriction endonuclease McrA